MRYGVHGTFLICAIAALMQQVAGAAEDPATDRALLGFARQVERSLNEGDPSYLRGSFDLDAVLDRSMKDIDAEASMREGFRKGVKSSFDLAGQITEVMKKQDGRYHLLRVRAGPDGRPQALFRMLFEGGVNYHEYALRRTPGGTVKATDVFIYLNGEWISDTFRRAWLLAAGESGLSGKLTRFLQGEPDFVRNVPQIREMHRLRKAGKNREALEICLKLPASLQSNKNLLMERVQIAAEVGDKEYAEAVDLFFKHFPADPALDLLLIDYYFNKKEYDRALTTVDRLAKAVGGDAQLDLIRANLHYGKKDYAAARRAGQQAIVAEPALLGPYWLLVTISLDEKSYPETARLLTTLERERGVRIGDLKGVESYAGFVISDSYAKWMKTRRRAKGPG